MNSQKQIFIIVISFALFFSCRPNIMHKNSGESISVGTVGEGSLENGYLLDYRKANFKYFSSISYYIFGNAYVNSKIYYTILDAYKECEITCGGNYFRIMECSNKNGGKMMMHRSHRNGLSVDFMVPKIKNGKQNKIYDHLGLWHYLLSFDSDGKLNLNKKVSIDFETLGRHLISLDNAAKKNGLVISKVILKINLKDNFFKTHSGKEISRRGIYFAQSLPKIVDDMHDDHYHIDFKLKK